MFSLTKEEVERSECIRCLGLVTRAELLQMSAESVRRAEKARTVAVISQPRPSVIAPANHDAATEKRRSLIGQKQRRSLQPASAT